jgi:predicted 3-demethylubiquinone-9 3-methyltransferase (glyoxalase superfamily)
MQRITPHLWFDKEAKEAAGFYTSIFKDSKIKTSVVLHDTPSGSVDVLTIDLMGQEFGLISAGPLFKFNPSVSFLVSLNSKTEVDALWSKLSERGAVLMPLGTYPFSEWYGWTQDRYGVSWQVLLDSEAKEKIIPTLLFVGKVCGKTEEAIRFYTSVFHDSKVGDIHRYAAGEEPDKSGTIKHASFTLEGQDFAAMDSARAHDFAFNEAISLIVHCDTQEEIDYYWSKLSAVREAEQCGWLKDKYGFSWQVTPAEMEEVYKENNPAKLARVTAAFLKMKKFDIKKLKEAAEG